ncbi:MAG: hypothetical protein ACETVU_05040 [Desulfatiglandales bacterium]
MKDVRSRLQARHPDYFSPFISGTQKTIVRTEMGRQKPPEGA